RTIGIFRARGEDRRDRRARLKQGFTETRRHAFAFRRISGSVGRRRSRAACSETPNRNSELARLVGEVFLDAGSGKDDDADRQDFQHRVIALEWRRLRMLGPVWLEG